MGKNLVVCCDGTANEFARDNTNVVKLYMTLQLDDQARQVAFYHPGLGTMEPAGALTTLARKVTKLLGMAIGYGLESDIRDAYVFLMRHFEEGDRVFFFGFSRGAYTVRCVCSLLHLYGLLRPGNETLVPYAVRMMMAIQRAGPESGGSREQLREYFALAEAFKQSMGRADCKPHFVGVWDTVSSVGWIENPLKLPFVTNNPDIAIGRQAVALDERRAFFRHHLWRRPEDTDAPSKPYGPENVKQVWFPGVHCDVGGGYPEAESSLAKIPLEWMLEEARTAGLLVNEDRAKLVLGQVPGKNFAPPDANGAMHESLKGLWKLAEFVPKPHYDWVSGTTRRRMNLFRRRTIPPKAHVHASAFERAGDYRKRLPADAVRVETERAPKEHP